jgi:hypothetical protein
MTKSNSDIADPPPEPEPNQAPVEGEGEAKPSSQKAVPTADTAGLSSSSEEGLAYAGEIPKFPPTFCKNCQTTETPTHKRKCPRCGQMLADERGPMRHRAKLERRKELLQRLVNEYHPQNTVDLHRCEQLASSIVTSPSFSGSARTGRAQCVCCLRHDGPLHWATTALAKSRRRQA